MKTALLHYWLTNMRGGEKVLSAFGEMFPDADIFTHAYIPDKVVEFNKFKVQESFIARLPLGRKHPQAYLPLLPLASRMFDLNGYDLILSNESGPIKGIRKPTSSRHICCCFTPMRYVWDLYDEYYAASGIGGKIAMRLFTPFMRKADLRSADSVDQFVAISGCVAERIKRIYGRESTIVFPPVDTSYYSAGNYQKKDYYVYAGELRAYKHPDFAVRACMKMNRKLVVVGNGGMRSQLEQETNGCPNIIFKGRVSDEELRQIYSEAKALLFPGIEDFGIVPVEAQAAGTPVIAYGAGGALDTVIDGKTGLYFHGLDVDSLCKAIEEFESMTWSKEECQRNALRFTKEKFIRSMRKVIEMH